MSDNQDSHSVSEMFDAPDSMFDDITLPEVTDRTAEEAIAAAEAKEASKQPNVDTTKVAEPEADEQPEPEAKVDEKEAAQDAVPAPVQSKKEIKFKVGDDEVALDEGASLEVRVDGKKQTVALKDLIQNYAGKIPIEKRLQEVAEARKVEAKRAAEIEAKIQRHASLINRMYESMQKGDLLGAIALQFEAAGRKEDPYEVVRQLRAAFREQAKNTEHMSEHELAAFELQEKNAYLQRKHEDLLKQMDSEKAQAQFQERVAKAMGSVNATMDDYVRERDGLKEQYKLRGMDPEQITPETVASHIYHVRKYESARDILRSVDPDVNLQDPKTQKVWDSIVQMQNANPDWSEDDIKEIVQTAMNKKRSASVSQKVAKAPVPTVAIAAAKAKTAPVNPKQQRQLAILKQDPKAYGEFGEDDLF